MEEFARRLLMSAINDKPRKLPKHIEDRIRANKCIHDGCDKPHHSRGCCQEHINQFYGLIRYSRSSTERAEKERKLAKAFLVLYPNEVRPYLRNDPFSKAIG